MQQLSDSKNWLHILKKTHLTYGQRLGLFIALFRVRLQRFFSERIKKKSASHISFLGYTFEVDTPGSFYGTFYEVFIREDYKIDSLEGIGAIIDAGANIGLAACYFSWRFPKLTIFAFEPHPETFSILEKNITQNRLTNVTAICAALDQQERVVTMRGGNRAATIEESMQYDAIDSNQVVDVQTTTLSSFLATQNHQSYILKMDIEGAEYAVLQDLDASNSFSCIRELLFEFHVVKNDPARYEKVRAILDRNEFVYDQTTSDRNDHFIVRAMKEV